MKVYQVFLDINGLLSYESVISLEWVLLVLNHFKEKGKTVFSYSMAHHHITHGFECSHGSMVFIEDFYPFCTFVTTHSEMWNSVKNKNMIWDWY